MWKKDKAYQMPHYMKIGITFFLLWMAFVGYRNEQKAEQGDPSATSIKRYEVLQQFADVDGWLKIANPNYNRDIRFEELRVGTKEQAACGQTVEMTAAHLPEEGEEPNPSLSAKTPIRFVIGDGSQLDAWDRGVRGMREGGIRRLWAGPKLVNPDEESLDAPAVVFDLELRKLTPNLPEDSEPFGFVSNRKAERPLGTPLDCGDEARISLRLLDKDGKTLYEQPENAPLVFTIGESTYGHGLDRGLIGAFPTESRRIGLPPAFQLKNDTIPYPLNEIAIVEVTRLPYNEVPTGEAPLPEQPVEKEPDHEPDSQPPERDQTIPDDGSDSESSGT